MKLAKRSFPLSFSVVKNSILTALFVLSLVVAFLLSSCDKVENPYPPLFVDIDTNLIEGMTYQEYKSTLWGSFSTNNNVDVNVLIEDFTGHKCTNCPYAAVEARAIEEAFDHRVFVASIHAGPNGSTPFQGTAGALFSNDFTNPNGLQISSEISDGGFIGNPSGTINRKVFGGQIFQNYGSWSGYTSGILATNSLKVNLQANTNYFPGTRGIIAHTEIDVKETITDDLYQVVYLIEDSLVSAQIVPAEWSFPSNIDAAYVHRDIHRGCLDGFAMGRKLTDADKKDKNGLSLTGNKYYLNYSYALPPQYEISNMHLLIFVYNGATKEVYQVIKKDL
jgi:hypothetical protein